MEAEQQATGLCSPSCGGPILSFCSGLLFPLSSWYLEGMQEALGGLANLGKGAPHPPSGAGDCISDSSWVIAAAAGPGTPHSEVLLLRTCCPKAGPWTSGSSDGT